MRRYGRSLGAPASLPLTSCGACVDARGNQEGPSSAGQAAQAHHERAGDGQGATEAAPCHTEPDESSIRRHAGDQQVGGACNTPHGANGLLWVL